MIQRIQSLLLAGVVILLTVNLFVPIWTSGPEKQFLTLNAFFISTPEQKFQSPVVYYIGVVTIVSIVLALYIIFQYKNRPLQLKLCNLLTLLTLGIIGSYFIAIPAAKSLTTEAANGNYEIGYFLPLISSVLIMGARYFIRKDEELVRSVDRIR